MNIFVTDTNPRQAARDLCDKHVVKMALETAQMLCTAHYVLRNREEMCAQGQLPPYRATHSNHPCTIWARSSEANYYWLVEHGLEICAEYTKRYGKRMKAQDVIEWSEKHVSCFDSSVWVSREQTPFAVAMPDEYKIKDDPVASYRNYYIGAKSHFAQWKMGEKPAWWPK